MSDPSHAALSSGNEEADALQSEIRWGLCLTYPAPGILERIGRDWDWIWLDGQHGQIASYDTMLAMVRGCELMGRPSFVRVSGNHPGWIGPALDMNASALIIPQIDTVEQAMDAVKSAKFPPAGNRSYGSRRQVDLYGRDYSNKHEARLICQIESPEALRNVVQIAALSGVDGLFLGPDDLSLRWGQSMGDRLDRPRLMEAIETVALACRESGKMCICPGLEEETIEFCLSLGIQYLVGGSESGLLTAGSKNRREIVREITLRAKQNVPSVSRHVPEASDPPFTDRSDVAISRQ